MYISDFFILKNNGFTDSFICIENALKYYYSDPEVCCTLFRKALESIINDVYSLFGSSVKGHNKLDIDNLDNVVPDKFYDDSIQVEMHNIRIIGNAYAHRGENFEYDVNKDKFTCYVAMKNIARWLVECKQLYPEYLRKEEERRKERKEKNNRVLKKIGKIALIVLGIGAAILGGSKISKK
ncbi:MAG: DUF4145 domain-containing protein [Bacteroidales bacterium]|nr:DUF4145 domain-containing protein [Bacteroidales bacterium]